MHAMTTGITTRDISNSNPTAKVLFTAVVADMRNKLNGTVFSKNRYGAYTRTKVTPVNPQTTAQQNARNRLSTNSQAWRGLTESERQGWIDAAVNFPFTDIFGNSKILSGQALFVKLNTNLSLIVGTPLTSAPSPIAIPALNSITAVADASAQSLNITIDPTPVPADFNLNFFTTGNVTPGKNFVKNLFRFTESASAATGPTLDISASFLAVHGDPVEDQKIFVRAQLVSRLTGQAGIPIQTVTIVVA